MVFFMVVSPSLTVILMRGFPWRLAFRYPAAYRGAGPQAHQRIRAASSSAMAVKPAASGRKLQANARPVARRKLRRVSMGSRYGSTACGRMSVSMVMISSAGRGRRRRGRGRWRVARREGRCRGR